MEVLAYFDDNKRSQTVFISQSLLLEISQTKQAAQIHYIH